MTAYPADLEAALLSLNSYDVGNQPSIKNLPQVGDTFGAYTVLKVSPVIQNTTNSFVAVAYQDGSGKVYISYRGTDNIDVNFFDDTDPTKADVIQGWTIGAGIEVLNQAPLAIQFYDSVVNDLAHSTDYSIFDEKPSGLPTIELTGHSLGGGLAGLVASLSGDKAVMFDHMPYGAAAYKIVADHYAADILAC